MHDVTLNIEENMKNETKLKILRFGKVHKTNDVIDCRVKNKIKNNMSKRIHNTNDVINNWDPTLDA